MSKAKHTAGPWRAVIPAGYGKDTLIMSGTDIVASLVRFEGKAANARLIAASPELKSRLESLSDMVIRKCNIGNDPALIDLLNEVQQSKELIKKIEG